MWYAAVAAAACRCSSLLANDNEKQQNITIPSQTHCALKDVYLFIFILLRISYSNFVRYFYVEMRTRAQNAAIYEIPRRRTKTINKTIFNNNNNSSRSNFYGRGHSMFCFASCCVFAPFSSNILLFAQIVSTQFILVLPMLLFFYTSFVSFLIVILQKRS